MDRLSRLAALALALLAASAVAGAQAASRVVALAPHLAELACAAGACSQLVARVAYSDQPPSVRALPVVGDAFDVDAEHLLAMRVELALVWRGGTPPALVERLERSGIDVLWLEVRSVDDVAAAIETIGERLGTAAVAREAAAGYRARIGALRERYRDAAPVTVMYQIDAEPIYTVGDQSPISQVIALCGGRNVFANLGAIAASVSAEEVLARDPQVVLYARGDGAAAIEAFWRRWPQARANREGHLYAVDSDLLVRSGPRLADGAEALCRLLDEVRAAAAGAP
jgi:ABC-type Fe3+-hydroxamate transport system substrate-binding protein